MSYQPISQNTRRVLEKIAGEPFLKKFYLAGGTALAIQLGHRESIDLDWFSSEEFSNKELKARLEKIGKFELTGEDAGTLHGLLDDVKISFLLYPYKILFPLQSFGDVRTADERDIATMKLDAISSRGSKKDFIDLYFLLEKYSLEELFDFFEKKFENINYNKLHILKSLVFFETAESEPMPKMIKDIEWEAVKKAIFQKASLFLKK